MEGKVSFGSQFDLSREGMVEPQHSSWPWECVPEPAYIRVAQEMENKAGIGQVLPSKAYP